MANLVTQQAKARLTGKLYRSARASSLLMEKFPALMERARSEKAPVVQARLYYEAALLGVISHSKRNSGTGQRDGSISFADKTGGYSSWRVENWHY